LGGRQPAQTPSSTPSNMVAPGPQDPWDFAARLQAALQRALARNANGSMHSISKFMSVRVTSDSAESSGRRTGAALNITIRVLHRDEIVEVLAHLLDLVTHRDPAGAGLFAQGHCEQMLILTDPGVGLAGAALAAKVTQVVRLSQEVMGQSCSVIEKNIAGAGEWPGIVLTVRGPPYLHAPRLGNVGHRAMQASVSTDNIFILPDRLHVRTIFDDISAHLHDEILTALAAADDRQASSRRLQILSRTEPHLATLQQFLNGCATYFHVIRRDLTEMLSGALDKVGQHLRWGCLIRFRWSYHDRRCRSS
jgi:hypothetical protein